MAVGRESGYSGKGKEGEGQRWTVEREEKGTSGPSTRGKCDVNGGERAK